MAAVKALKLVDPDGSVMVLTKIDDLVFTVAYELAEGAGVFRLFEDTRAELRAFLTPLAGS
jgi:hypothetical protein